MLLKHRFVPLPRTKKQEKVESEDDAWLNDVGPAPQSPIEGEPEEALTLDSENRAAVDQAASVSQPHAYIGPGHRLWPLVLGLSEHIWQELYQRSEASSAPESILMKLVQKRALDLLREESRIARQIRDINEAKLVLSSIGNEVLGYGPLEELMNDESVFEIMAIGPRIAYIERNGEIEDVPCYFEDDRHMVRIIENMLRRAGRRMQPNWPIVDVRLPEGFLVNVVMPPNAANGPTIKIRKGTKKPITIDDLVQSETLTCEMAEFLRACIQARLNIVICGSVGSGRTTLLNALSAYIPDEERIATIEEAAELRLSQKHVVALVSQLTNPGNMGGVTMRDLVVNALRIGSEHILLRECRGDEVEEMFQAMNNGYGGFLITLYAQDLRNCLTRLETMYELGGANLPVRIVRAQIATALDVIVHVSRLRDGTHKILNIVEVQGMENDVIKLQSIFHFMDADFDTTTGELKRSFEPSGFCPTFLPKLEDLNIHLPPEMFKPPLSA